MRNPFTPIDCVPSGNLVSPHMMKTQFSGIPFAPGRCPVFYGWVVMVFGAAGFIMSIPGQTYGVAPFTEPLIDALGLTRVELSTAYMLGTMLSACVLVQAGKLYDRYGARVIAPAACLVMGGTLAVMSRCDHIAAGFSSGADSEATRRGSFALILVCFFLLRFSAQGVLTMVSLNMVMKWFDRHRGLVSGIMGIFTGPVFSATPILLNNLVMQVGWRQAWIWLALLCGLGFAIVSLVFYRDSPEECGLTPDGHPAPGKATASTGPVRRQFTAPEARRTYAFWAFTGGLSLAGCFLTGLGFHIESVFESAGKDGQLGYEIFLPAALITLVLRPFVGWVCDHIPLKYLLMTLALSLCTSGIGLAALRADQAHWILIAGNGVCGAVFGTIISVTWPNFFGRAHLGAISGTCMSVMVFTSAIGPWAFGSLQRTSDGYSRVGIIAAALALALFAMAFKADNPQPHPAQG